MDVTPPNHTSWVTAVITQARERNTAVPDDIWKELETLITDKLSQRPLPPGELARIAMQLIQDFASGGTSTVEMQ
jgi:hypothetical protein